MGMSADRHGMKVKSGPAQPALVGDVAVTPVLRQRPVARRGSITKVPDAHHEELIKLYWAIHQEVEGSSGRIIEITSASPREGVSTVVLGLADAASSIGHARVLICYVMLTPSELERIGASRQASLEDVSAGEIRLDQAIQTMKERGHEFCVLLSPGVGSQIAVDIDALDPILAELRTRFDFILIDAPATSRSHLGLILAKKADGVVLVVEAERTRAPVVITTQRMLEANGGHILGVVLNKRRMHIPRFLYRMV